MCDKSIQTEASINAWDGILSRIQQCWQYGVEKKIEKYAHQEMFPKSRLQNESHYYYPKVLLVYG